MRSHSINMSLNIALLVALTVAFLGQADAGCPGREEAWCKGECYWNGWECKARESSCGLYCPQNYEPVCGEDGKTYGNECEACGVKVACQGKCPCQVPSCGDREKAWCTGECFWNGRKCKSSLMSSCAGREKSWCNGDCYWNGWECEAQEDQVPSYCVQYQDIFPACVKNYDPVCGENGETYGNECEACRDKVKVACQGKCPCGGSSCAGREKSWCNGDCYWNGWECKEREPSCGGREKAWCTGECFWNGRKCKSSIMSSCAGREKSWCNGDCYWNGWECEAQEDQVPSYCVQYQDIFPACVKNYDPVCGENGVTFGNECEACLGKVKVACQGKCPCGGSSCGGREKSWCNGDCYWNGWECKNKLK